MEYLEQPNCPLHIIYDFHAGRVRVVIARRSEGIDASTMLVPFVLPEMLCCALVREPIRVHVLEQVSLAKGVKNVGDISILWGEGAELVIGAIAEVGPVSH